MAHTQSLLYSLCSLLLFLACVEGLKFDVQAYSKGDKQGQRCIRNFVTKDTLVVVTATIDGYKGDGMNVNMDVSVNANFSAKHSWSNLQIRDAVGNEYGKPKDVVGEKRMAFTSHANAFFDVCFENYFTGGRWSLCLSSNLANSLLAKGVQHPFRQVELDIDVGADAKDWSAVQATEKLKPVETELRRIEEMVAEIVSEMDYLRTREQKLRDTNESTNTRVKWFAFTTMGMLVSLGVWQIVYLRAYFRYVIYFEAYGFRF